jgi:hypothetical protein
MGFVELNWRIQQYWTEHVYTNGSQAHRVAITDLCNAQGFGLNPMTEPAYQDVVNYVSNHADAQTQAWLDLYSALTVNA